MSPQFRGDLSQGRLRVGVDRNVSLVEANVPRANGKHGLCVGPRPFPATTRAPAPPDQTGHWSTRDAGIHGIGTSRTRSRTGWLHLTLQ